MRYRDAGPGDSQRALARPSPALPAEAYWHRRGIPADDDHNARRDHRIVAPVARSAQPRPVACSGQ
jgi:hypothetical protein